MRKCLRTLAIAVALVLALGVTAFASETDPIVTPADSNTTAAFDSKFVKLESLTYKNDAIVAGGQYMVFVVTANAEGEYIPTESSILYINQAQASADGEITFSNVYPKTVTDSAVMISGTGLAAPVVVATIDVPYLKGDVSLDGTVDSWDATLVLRHDAGLTELDAAQINVADVSGDGIADSWDATLILRFDAGLIEEFPAK
ncbi:MAG: dockerin type I repeat-containing protein [Clostridia bacterium]|nr:dockerin type I repeat-containing protein [Clostridia bacterium]